MRKFTLKEYNEFLDNFESIIRESMHLSEASSSDKSNKGIDVTKNNIMNYMRQMASDGGRFQDAAREIGLNPDGFERGQKEYQKQYNAGFNAEMEKGISQRYDQAKKQLVMTVDPQMTQEILDAAQRIREYINQNKYGGTVNWDAFKEDPDYTYLMRMKDLMDRKGLTSLYDDNAPDPSDQGYGVTNGDATNFDYTGFLTDKNGNISSRSYDSVTDFWTSRVRNFVESKYGFDIDIPNTAFAAGNKKLPNSTLIVNFTSAMRCPAWNECLVKHACYARGDEKPHTAVLKANTRRYLLWELTRGDDKMLKLVMNMVKAYMFNYESIYSSSSRILKKNNIKNINELIDLDLDNEIITQNLSELFKKYRNVTNVRLNENGDFLGQWLVDEWDRLGGMVKEYGITISAYTCRNLNFEGIKNIVLNSSNVANKNVDRYFIAISSEAYDSFDETHEGFDRETGRLKTVLKPLGNIDENGNWTPNGNMYYKCPCSNEEIMGPEKSRKQKTSMFDYDCYKCNTCYTPNIINNGKPYYVFVKVHHGTEAFFQERDGGSFRFGYSEHYLENKEKLAQAAPVEKVKKNVVKENIEDQSGVMSQNDALKQVTNNMVTSMNNHFSSYNPVMEENKVKEDFNQLLERINNTEF